MGLSLSLSFSNLIRCGMGPQATVSCFGLRLHPCWLNRDTSPSTSCWRPRLSTTITARCGFRASPGFTRSGSRHPRSRACVPFLEWLESMKQLLIDLLGISPCWIGFTTDGCNGNAIWCQDIATDPSLFPKLKCKAVEQARDLGAHPIK